MIKPLTEKQMDTLAAVYMQQVKVKVKQFGWREIRICMHHDRDCSCQIRALRARKLIRYTYADGFDVTDAGMAELMGELQ